MKCPVSKLRLRLQTVETGHYFCSHATKKVTKPRKSRRTKIDNFLQGRLAVYRKLRKIKSEKRGRASASTICSHFLCIPSGIEIPARRFLYYFFLSRKKDVFGFLQIISDMVFTALFGKSDFIGKIHDAVDRDFFISI